MSILSQLNKTNLDKIQENFTKFVVRPLNTFGIAGFVFDIDRDSVINLKAEITDHYVEDNTTVQDHIAIRPLTVVLGGYVGELNNSIDNPDNDTFQTLAEKLTTLEAYVPQLTDMSLQAKDLVGGSNLSVETVTSTAGDLWALTQNLNPNTTNQQKAYLYFKAIMEQKLLLGLETPFEYLTNMVVESIEALQSEDSQYISEFSITLKQIRVAGVEFVPFEASTFQPKADAQIKDVVDKGTLSGKQVATNLVDGLLNKYAGI